MKKKHTSNKPILYRPKFKDNIPGYPGYYVSKFGKAYTRNNVGVIGLGYLNTLGLWRELTPAITNLNRCKVSLRDQKGKKLYIQVSRLVAKVYIPNPEINLVYVIRIIILVITVLVIYIGVHRKKILNNVLEMGGILDGDTVYNNKKQEGA